MSKIYVPITLRQFTNNRSILDITGGTIAELLTEMDKRCPGIRGQLYNENGRINSHIAVFINDINIRDLKHEETPVQERDEVYIIPAFAGG
ncbi:MoaD/ThiS family protein [Nostoc sp. FACHB-973]|nr:MoaD/ThiS family protein [Nostoc sp. FACHB-973]